MKRVSKRQSGPEWPRAAEEPTLCGLVGVGLCWVGVGAGWMGTQPPAEAAGGAGPRTA